MSKIFVFKNAEGFKSKWEISPFKFVLLLSLLNSIGFQRPLITYTIENLSIFSFSGLQILFNLIFIPFTCTAILFFVLLLVHRYIAKLMFACLVIINSLFLYYIESRGTVLDENLVGFLFEQTTDDSFELISMKSGLYVFFYALIPSVLILKFRIAPVSRFNLSIKIIILSLIALFSAYFSFQSSYWLNKHSKYITGAIIPWSYIAHSIKHFSNNQHRNHETLILPSANTEGDNKTVVVLVIGDSTRSKNYSLYGYGRDTNPRLTEKNVIALQNSTSCDTNSKSGLDCILSHVEPSNKQYEPLPSFLQKNNVEVWWRSNNTLNKDLNISKFESAEQLRNGCESIACYTDEILMKSLIQDIQSSQSQNIFVVLHQSGSKGPDYSSQYPAFFEQFMPICKTGLSHSCEQQELINAYDNSIYYNDFVLSSLIDQLQTVQERDAVMLYISNHGESLGEAGIYQHGLPKVIAPAEQLDIPFLVWMSDSFKINHNINNAESIQKDKHSQLNVFHSVLGALNLQSKIYNKELDLFYIEN